MLTRRFHRISPHLFLITLSLLIAAPVFAAETQTKTAQPSPTAQKKPATQKKPVARPAPTAQKKPVAQKNATTTVAVKSPAPAAKKAVPAKAAAKTAAKGKPAPLSVPEKLQADLDVFAKKCVISMNNQLKPGLKSKEVNPHPSGGYVARYMTVDPDSLTTSYNPTENNKYVQYIGKMLYHEVEYSCVGQTKEQALAGPFNEVNRIPVTELIKYMKGKWTY